MNPKQTDGFPTGADVEPPPLIRPWFLVAFLALVLIVVCRFAVPGFVRDIGYNWEAGRAQAASEALAKLDEKGVLNQSSALFRLAATRSAPSVVHIETQGPNRIGVWSVTSGMGSGIVVDKAKGFVITNAHVIRDATEIRVQPTGGKELRARLTGMDPKTDLAVLQVLDPSGLPGEAVWGDSENLEPGEWVLAVGNPFGLDRTVTAGIISATRRNSLGLVGPEGYEDWIQTDAAVNPGNSGGPLINLRGEVLGINTAILSETGGSQGVGLAIPAKIARQVAEQIISKGRVLRGYLGVILQPMNDRFAKDFGNPNLDGVIIAQVQPNGPADKAGIKTGDVIIAINDKAVQTVQEMRNRISQSQIGSKAKLTVLRDKQENPLEISADIAELPTIASLGFSTRPLTPEETETNGLKSGQGVVIDKVDARSPAEQAGLESGMRILNVGSIRIDTKAQCDALLGRLAPGQTIRLRVGDRREEKVITLTVGP